MLDTRRTPDISDLGNLCRRYLDIAEMLENFACNVTMPNHATDPEAWKDADRMCSAVLTLTDALREVSAVASVLDGYERPEVYGFPPAPIRTPHTDAYKTGYDAGYSAGINASIDLAKRIQQERAAAKSGQDPDSADGSYLAGYADGLKAADDTDGKGYTLEDGESLADFARRIQNLTAEQLDDLTADEKENSAFTQIISAMKSMDDVCDLANYSDQDLIYMLRGVKAAKRYQEERAQRILSQVDKDDDDREDGAEQ